MSISMLIGSLVACGFKVVLSVIAVRSFREARREPAGSPERIIGTGELTDELLGLFQVLVMLGFSIILVLGVAFGTVNLDGPAGVILALLWVTLALIPPVIGQRRLVVLRQTREAIAAMRSSSEVNET